MSVDAGEERDAIVDWQAGDLLAGARLVEMHEGLVRTIVRRYVTERCELDDLLQVGRMALLCAATEHDASKGRLSTFAFYKVNGRARNYSRHGRYVVTVSEAADRKKGHRPAAVWLDAPFGEGGDTIGSCLAVPVADPMVAADAEALVSTLPAREREVLRRLYYGVGETLQEIGESMGVSKQRIGKIKADAIDALRQRVAA